MEKDSNYDDDEYDEYADYEDSSSEGCFNEDDSDSEGTMMEELDFTRKTSEQIGREYTPVIIDQEKLYSILQSKIVEVRNTFEYIELDEGFILKNLRENNFIVSNTCQNMQEKVLKLIENPQKENGAMKEEGKELICMVDKMEVEKHNTKSLACGHPVCNECWSFYIQIKVKEGLNCINLTCPVDGCNKAIPINFIEEIAEKETAKM